MRKYSFIIVMLLAIAAGCKKADEDKPGVSRGGQGKGAGGKDEVRQEIGSE